MSLYFLRRLLDCRLAMFGNWWLFYFLLILAYDKNIEYDKCIEVSRYGLFSLRKSKSLMANWHFLAGRLSRHKTFWWYLIHHVGWCDLVSYFNDRWNIYGILMWEFSSRVSDDRLAINGWLEIGKKVDKFWIISRAVFCLLGWVCDNKGFPWCSG